MAETWLSSDEHSHPRILTVGDVVRKTLVKNIKNIYIYVPKKSAFSETHISPASTLMTPLQCDAFFGWLVIAVV